MPIGAVREPRPTDPPDGRLREALCARQNLVPKRTELTESPLLRGDDIFGMQFVLYGPSSLRFVAI